MAAVRVVSLLKTLAQDLSGWLVDVLSRRPLGRFFAGILIFLLLAPTIFVLRISMAGILVIPFLLYALIANVLFGKILALGYISGSNLGDKRGLAF